MGRDWPRGDSVDGITPRGDWGDGRLSNKTAGWMGGPGWAAAGSEPKKIASDLYERLRLVPTGNCILCVSSE